MNLSYPHYGNVDSIETSDHADYRDPAYEAGHGRVSAYPERTLEARVARAYDQHHEQVQYAGPDEQADGSAYRGEYYAGEEPTEASGAKSQGDYATKNRRSLIADDREDQRVYEVALAPDAAEKASGCCNDVPHRVYEALDRITVVELATRSPTRYPARCPARPPTIARFRVEIHVNLLSHRTWNN